ncbi:MAG: D-2-hydroxyacid dehydrogenase [Clostridia bacterium]|nr:D-2-hydroxyacid dehydrogenase [Clostridia bacterium]
MKIVVLEAGVMTPGGLSLKPYEQFGEVTYYHTTKQSEVIERIGDAEIILMNKLVIDKQVMDACPNLKYIGLFATGYNTIDVKYAAKKGITVCNAGSYSTTAVAQHTMALILNHFNQIANYHNAVKDGAWEKSELTTLYDFPTDEVYGKTIGIVGYGHIGKRVAQLASAFDMKVLAYTRTPKDDGVAEFVSFEELLCRSDIISLHLPLTDESRLIMNKDTFAKCKKGAFFVNTARGGLVDEPALKEVVESGHLSGAALDAITVEPMRNCVLQGVDNIVITPHAAWAPMSTRIKLLNITVDCIKGWLSGNPINDVTKL